MIKSNRVAQHGMYPGTDSDGMLWRCSRKAFGHRLVIEKPDRSYWWMIVSICAVAVILMFMAGRLSGKA